MTFHILATSVMTIIFLYFINISQWIFPFSWHFLFVCKNLKGKGRLGHRTTFVTKATSRTKNDDVRRRQNDLHFESHVKFIWWKRFLCVFFVNMRRNFYKDAVEVTSFEVKWTQVFLAAFVHQSFHDWKQLKMRFFHVLTTKNDENADGRGWVTALRKLKEKRGSNALASAGTSRGWLPGLLRTFSPRSWFAASGFRWPAPSWVRAAQKRWCRRLQMTVAAVAELPAR